MDTWVLEKDCGQGQLYEAVLDRVYTDMHGNFFEAMFQGVLCEVAG